MLALDGSGVLRSFTAASFWNRFGTYLKDCAAVFYRVFFLHEFNSNSEVELESLTQVLGRPCTEGYRAPPANPGPSKGGRSSRSSARCGG